MKILRAYTLRELVLPFVVAIGVLTFIFLLGYLVKMADLLVGKGVSMGDISKIILLMMPQLLTFTLPTAVLTAVLLVFGGFAQNNEITAFKASGINVVGIMLPVIVIAFILSVVALFINDQVLPKTSFAFRRTVNEMLIKRPAAYLEEGRFIKEFRGYVIFTKEINGNQLKGVTIYQPQGEGKPIRTIAAERGEIISDPVQKTVSLRLYHGTSDEVNPDNPEVIYKLDFETFELPPLDIAGRNTQLERKIKDMTIDELVMKLRETHPDLKDQVELTTRFKSEIHKKIAFSFASLVFALIGLPLAIITKRGEAIVSFLLAMSTVAVYYVLFVWANTVAVRGLLPPAVSLWIPNALLATISIVLFTKVIRL